MSGIFNPAIWNNAIFNTGAAGPVTPPVEVAPWHGTGDNIAKPTGLVKRKTLTLKKNPEIDHRIEISRQIQAEVAEQLAREFTQENQEFIAKDTAIEQRAIDAEIAILLRKKIRTEEEELFLLMVLAAAV